MEIYPRSTTQRIATIRSNRWAAGLTAMLVSTAMILSACGGSDEPAEATATTVAATVETSGATPTEATVADETPEASATEVVETETSLITETNVLTETNVTTDVNVTQVTTETVVTTGTVETGAQDTSTSTESETITESEEIEATPEATVTSSEESTDTESLDDSDTTTETGSIGTGTTDTAGTTPAMMGATGAPNQYVRASTLLDYNFTNMDGEVSGDLEDLLIDLSTGRVLFASIEYGGVLDLGDKDIVVPLNAFKVGPDNELVLNIDENSLANYPDVGNDWPDLNDPAWDDDVVNFWSESGITPGINMDQPSTSVAWASDLMDDEVADLGAGAGSILDILVNVGTAQAPYIIVDYGEGLDTDPYIIPLSAYDVTNRDAGLVYRPDFTPDILTNAPRFDQDMYPEGSPLDNDFGDRIESAWNDLGFSNDLNRDGQVD